MTIATLSHRVVANGRLVRIMEAVRMVRKRGRVRVGTLQDAVKLASIGRTLGHRFEVEAKWGKNYHVIDRG